jgi:hypothetical protein
VVVRLPGSGLAANLHRLTTVVAFLFLLPLLAELRVAQSAVGRLLWAQLMAQWYVSAHFVLLANFGVLSHFVLVVYGF